MGFDGDCRGMSRGLKMRRRRETEKEEESAACSPFPLFFFLFFFNLCDFFVLFPVFCRIPSFFISFLLVVCEEIEQNSSK